MKLGSRDGMAVNVGIELVVSVLLGLALGYWLDKKLGTAPWCTLGGIVLGTVAGFRSLFKLARARSESDSTDEARPHGHEPPQQGDAKPPSNPDADDPNVRGD